MSFLICHIPGVLCWRPSSNHMCRQPTHVTSNCNLNVLKEQLSADVQAVPTALRGAFQSCGQNCAGAERFLVQEGVFDNFLAAITDVARRLRQGPAVDDGGSGTVDLGAMCMPGLAEKVAVLVDEAVANGAKVCRCSFVLNFACMALTRGCMSTISDSCCSKEMLPLHEEARAPRNKVVSGVQTSQAVAIR